MKKLILPFAALAIVVGCGGEQTPSTQTPATSDTSAAQTTPPAPASAAPDTAEPEPSASASASAAASAKAPPKPSSGGGTPPVIKEDATEVTDSFGSRPAKLKVGEGTVGTLFIPENALAQGTNITFKIDAKGKANGAPVGKIYHVISVIPPAGTPSVVSTAGPPFELVLPAGAKKDANLAIGKIETDDKGHDKLKWTVIAPKRIDDAAGLAYFEITDLGDLFVHITTKPPTEAKK